MAGAEIVAMVTMAHVLAPGVPVIATPASTSRPYGRLVVVAKASSSSNTDSPDTGSMK